MTGKVREDLDALDLMMQSHRELESLFSEFEYLQKNRKDTRRVIANACTEIRIHDVLEAGIFYPAVDGIADEETKRLLAVCVQENIGIMELVGKLQRSRPDERDAYFALIAERVKRHVAGEETELYPRVKKLPRLDLAPATAEMKRRNAELIVEMDGAALAETA